MNRMKQSTIEIARFGRRLGTRAEGVAARRALLAVLENLAPDGQLVLSLRDIDVLSGSFADEAIGKTCQLLTSGVYGERTVIVASPSVGLTEDLSDKLAQRKLAVLCRVDDADPVWRLLGRLAAPLEETLFLLIERGTATTRELAEALRIGANVCHNRMRRLVQLRLIREERIDVSAPHTQYRFHSIVEG